MISSFFFLFSDVLTRFYFFLTHLVPSSGFVIGVLTTIYKTDHSRLMLFVDELSGVEDGD